MAGLPATDEFSYNGVEFVGARNMKVTATPVFDEAQRVVACQEITIQLEAFVSKNDEVADAVNALTPALGDVELGTTMNRIRRLLEQRGRTLIFSGSGFHHNFRVNDISSPDTSTIDLKGGPVPKVLEWEPIGGDVTARVVWSVTTWIKDNIFYNNVVGNPLMAFNYAITFDIEDGYTTRTVSGYMEIARLYRTDSATSAAGSLVIPRAPEVPYYSVDEFWERLICEAPTSFKRRSSRTVSPDRTRLDFNIVDTQIRSRNAYPPFIINIDARHKVAWRLGGGQGAKLFNSISANIEAMPGAPPSYTYEIFNAMAAQRMRQAQENLKAQGKKTSVFVFDFEAEEEMFGVVDSYSLRYWILGSLADFLCSGLWTPLDTDWKKWRTSLKETVFSPRGTAELQHLPIYDAIISLDYEPRQPIAGSSDAYIPSPQRLKCLCYVNKKPAKESSYLGYSQEVVSGHDNPAVRQSASQAPILNAQDGQSMVGDARPGYYNQSPVSDYIQVGGAPQHFVTLQGRAIRAGYPVPKPNLLSVGGAAASAIHDGFSQKLIANMFGVPVYAAAWLSHYMLSNAPGQYPIPANPDQQLTKDGKSKEQCKDQEKYGA